MRIVYIYGGWLVPMSFRCHYFRKHDGRCRSEMFLSHMSTKVYRLYCTSASLESHIIRL
jgi:hypothetical protein